MPMRTQTLLQRDSQMTDAPEILLIEDDEQIRRILQPTLAAERYFVREASTVAGGALLALQRFADLIILDLGLPDGNGIEVIRKVREAKLDIPIIVLSVCSNERDKIAALDAGADDFISKPVAMGELLARVRVALRRSAQATARTSLSTYRTGEIEVNLKTQHIDI